MLIRIGTRVMRYQNQWKRTRILGIIRNCRQLEIYIKLVLPKANTGRTQSLVKHYIYALEEHLPIRHHDQHTVL